MPLETATYISDLVTSNPAGSDGMNNADDHIRLIKAAVKTTFPNITGAVAATHTFLNALAAGTQPLTIPAGSVTAPGLCFAGDTNTGIYQPAADQLEIACGGVAQVLITTTQVLYLNPILAPAVSATNFIGGTGELVPVGATFIWWASAPPTGYAWCNGQSVSRTAFPILFGLFGTAYGSVDGASFNLPDLREAVPVGVYGMGSTASRSLLNSISTGLKGVMNAVFGADTHTLTAAEIPSITTTVSGSVSVTSTTSDITRGGTSDVYVGGGSGNIYRNPTQSAITSTGTLSGVTGTSNNTGGAAHSIVAPSVAVGYIIRMG